MPRAKGLSASLRPCLHAGVGAETPVPTGAAPATRFTQPGPLLHRGAVPCMRPNKSSFPGAAAEWRTAVASFSLSALALIGIAVLFVLTLF
jgi:hypothetical protein